MPAIDLERLRTNIILLKRVLNNPPEFVLKLREIYYIYSDRTHPLPNYHIEIHALPAFNTPALLNLELEQTFSEYCAPFPVDFLKIIDLLWQQPEIELRQLAAVLLGHLPIEEKDAVITRIVDWSQNQEDALLLPYLHEKGSATLRRLDPQAWLNVLEKWRSSTEIWQSRLSIQGVISLIDDRNFANLPAVFTFLSPLFLNLDTTIQYDLGTTLQHLVKRSEVETVFFLKQIIINSRNPTFGRFLRRYLDLFTPEKQESLRRALRENDKWSK